MIQGANELIVELGYPGLINDGTEIPDERNNPLILDIFSRDGKLIDWSRVFVDLSLYKFR